MADNSKWLTYLLTEFRRPLLLILILIIFLHSTSFPQVKLIHDVTFINIRYPEGQYAGEKLVVYDDGEVERYKKGFRIFYFPRSTSESDNPITESLIKTSYTADYNLNVLDELFDVYANDYKEIPLPLEGNKFTPKIRHTVTYYRTEGEYHETFIFYDHMRGNYSSRLNDFIDKLLEKIYSFINEFVPMYVL